MDSFQIITFYEFKNLTAAGLPDLRSALRTAMSDNSIKGTIILAEEGFNATVCGEPEAISRFIAVAQQLLNTVLDFKTSIHAECPFRKIDVKIKPEIVTLKERVDMRAGEGTHVDPADWNAVISDPSVVILDTRNDYEFRSGTFAGSINPSTEKFSDLPDFIDANLDPEQHPRVAMFCTGGIRCEKFAPLMKARGFKEVYQLRGGILRYLEETPAAESLWQGECFVFDERRTVDKELRKGISPDYSQKGERE